MRYIVKWFRNKEILMNNSFVIVKKCVQKENYFLFMTSDRLRCASGYKSSWRWSGTLFYSTILFKLSIALKLKTKLISKSTTVKCVIKCRKSIHFFKNLFSRITNKHLLYWQHKISKIFRVYLFQLHPMWHVIYH